MSIETIIRNIIGNKKFNKFLLYLEKDGKDFDNYYVNSTIIFALISLFLVGLFITNLISSYFFILFFIIAYPLAFFINYIFVLYKEETKQKEIEEMLPDFLLQASLMPKGADITDVLKNISKQNFGYLSKEFKIALDQINKGFSVETALKGIIVRNKNKTLKRIINLLIIGYKSGKDLTFVFNKLSQDLLKTQSIERDRYSGLAIQKYTLLVSSAVLVPMVLSWVFGIIGNLDLSLFTDSGLVNTDPKLLIYAKYAIYIYIFEFSVLASIFISIIDGNWKKFVIYALFLIPIAYIVFLI